MSYNKSLLIFDYIEKTLEEEMLALTEFSEDDLWFLIDSCVGALHFL